MDTYIAQRVERVTHAILSEHQVNDHREYHTEWFYVTSDAAIAAVNKAYRMVKSYERRTEKRHFLWSHVWYGW